jgi:hypothetical protein
MTIIRLTWRTFLQANDDTLTKLVAIIYVTSIPDDITKHELLDDRRQSKRLSSCC